MGVYMQRRFAALSRVMGLLICCGIASTGDGGEPSTWEKARAETAEAWESSVGAGGAAWEATKESSANAWETTKQTGSEVWGATKDASQRHLLSR